VWLALAEGAGFDNYLSGSGQYDYRALQRLADRAGAAWADGGLTEMPDEWKPTGVWDAVLIHVLRDIGMDESSVAAMSAQERIDAVRSAADDGTLTDDTVEMLRRMGILDD
jgi:hypothetical protein